MEPLTFFASTVIFIGAFHLLSTAVEAISNSRYATETDTIKKRSDWYCFFSLSSLLGRGGMHHANTSHQDLSTETAVEDHKRRQQAQRPRIYTS